MGRDLGERCYGLNLMKVGVLQRQFKHTMLNIIKCIEHTVETL